MGFCTWGSRAEVLIKLPEDGEGLVDHAETFEVESLPKANDLLGRKARSTKKNDFEEKHEVGSRLVDQRRQYQTVELNATLLGGGLLVH